MFRKPITEMHAFQFFLQELGLNFLITSRVRDGDEISQPLLKNTVSRGSLSDFYYCSKVSNLSVLCQVSYEPKRKGEDREREGRAGLT